MPGGQPDSEHSSNTWRERGGPTCSLQSQVCAWRLGPCAMCSPNSNLKYSTEATCCVAATERFNCAKVSSTIDSSSTRRSTVTYSHHAAVFWSCLRIRKSIVPKLTNSRVLFLCMTQRAAPSYNKHHVFKPSVTNRTVSGSLQFVFVRVQQAASTPHRLRIRVQ